MQLSYAPYSLLFKHPFGLSYGTRATTEVVFVKLSVSSYEGYGEASLPPYLGESQESVISFFQKAKTFLSTLDENFNLNEIISGLDKIEAGNSAAKAALDIALHDLKSKTVGVTLRSFLKLSNPVPQDTSVTVSIGSIDVIRQKIEEASEFSIIKVKLGTTNDKQIVDEIRKYSDKKLILDINQGWKSLDKAFEMLNWLGDKDILYIEQPMPKENLKELKELREKSELPIIADEGFTRLSDLDRINGVYHGINVKLMKCTGIKEAMEIISEARKRNLKINLGCMSESSCAVSAAAQLMGLVDWVDLDGPFLTTNDPFTGITYSNGKVVLNEKKGIGAEQKVEINLNWT